MALLHLFKRSIAGRELTWGEVDSNWSAIEDLVNQPQVYFELIDPNTNVSKPVGIHRLFFCTVPGQYVYCTDINNAAVVVLAGTFVFIHWNGQYCEAISLTGASGQIMLDFTNTDEVLVQHNLHKYPMVLVLDSSGREMVAEIVHDTLDRVIVKLATLNSGKIIVS